MSDIKIFTLSHTENCRATPEVVFSIWKDVENWPRWDLGLSSCEFSEKFVTGSRFNLTPRGTDSSVNAILTEVVENARFVDETELPFGRVSFVHDVKPTSTGCEITHSIHARIDADKAAVFEEMAFSNMKRGLAPSVEGLARLAEKELESA